MSTENAVVVPGVFVIFAWCGQVSVISVCAEYCPTGVIIYLSLLIVG